METGLETGGQRVCRVRSCLSQRHRRKIFLLIVVARDRDDYSAFVDSMPRRLPRVEKAITSRTALDPDQYASEKITHSREAMSLKPIRPQKLKTLTEKGGPDPFLPLHCPAIDNCQSSRKDSATTGIPRASSSAGLSWATRKRPIPPPRGRFSPRRGCAMCILKAMRMERFWRQTSRTFLVTWKRSNADVRHPVHGRRLARLRASAFGAPTTLTDGNPHEDQ